MTYKAQSASKLVKHLICAAALAIGGVAQAGVLNFEGSVDSPIVFNGDHIEAGKFWIESYTGTASAGDMAGLFVDGSDTSLCSGMGMACPVNNSSQYYAALADSYFYFGMNDNTNFRLRSLKASFIGDGQSSFPAVAGILVIQGFNALDQAVGAALQVPLSGPVNGLFNFSTFDLTSLTTAYNYVRVLGYACDAGGNCNRSGNLANFAIDDITTIPEPGSMALFGLGLAGLGALARRRRAV